MDGLALADEDFAVYIEEVFALHAGATGDTADEEGPVGTAESFVDIAGGGDAGEEGESAVCQLHADASESVHGFLVIALDEAEVDGLVWAEQGTGGDAEEEGITNLTGGTGDGNGDGGVIHQVGGDKVAG